MATSGTNTYFSSLETMDICQEAAERCGIDFSKVSGNQLDSMRRSLQMGISSLGNKGPNLWKTTLQTSALTAAQSTVTLTPQCIEMLQVYVTDTNVSPNIDYVLSAISRADYAALPYKTQAGYRPNQYYFERTITPTVALWPVQDNAGIILKWYQWSLQEDVGALTNQIDAPNRWIEYICADLAWRTAVKWAPDRVQSLKVYAQEEFAAAAAEDVESVPLRVVPNMQGMRFT